MLVGQFRKPMENPQQERGVKPKTREKVLWREGLSPSPTRSSPRSGLSVEIRLEETCIKYTQKKTVGLPLYAIKQELTIIHTIRVPEQLISLKIQKTISFA